jgi:aryl-alcohol dehydrogenase-like predicted oxidoreductase
MHRIELPGLGLETSSLGMGCAALGSRVPAGAGLRALAKAHEAGVAWYDVAPAYGAGMAEELLGRFLAGRARDSVQICTKVGLVPPRHGPLTRALRSLLSPIVSTSAPLRRALRRTGATANRAIELTPAAITTSVERSLKRLGTDHVDVLALHNAQLPDLLRGDVQETLSRLVAAGKIRAAAVAGSGEVALEALRRDLPLSILQFSTMEPEAPAVLAEAHEAGRGCVTHSVFGVAGAAIDGLARRLRQQPDLAAVAEARLDAAGLMPKDAPDRKDMAAVILLAEARAANPRGVVLASMFSASSLALNVAGAEAPPPVPGFLGPGEEA